MLTTIEKIGHRLSLRLSKIAFPTYKYSNKIAHEQIKYCS